MNRAEIMQKLESEIKAEMIRIYNDQFNVWSVIFICENGTTFTREYNSINEWTYFRTGFDYYPVFELNPVWQYDPDENPLQSDLEQWADSEYRESLYWAHCADLDEKEEEEFRKEWED